MRHTSLTYCDFNKFLFPSISRICPLAEKISRDYSEPKYSLKKKRELPKTHLKRFMKKKKVFIALLSFITNELHLDDLLDDQHHSS